MPSTSQFIRTLKVILVIILLANVITGSSYRQSEKNSLTFYDASVGEKHLQTNLSDGDKCLVPCDEIVDGGPPKDGIPSIDDPKYYSVNDADSVLSDNDVIMGVQINGQMYGYSHDILNYHEIVNHVIEGAIMSITYCPLTGTGIPFKQPSELGTSGNLYENNLVYYDRQTDSYWSQIYGLSIAGEKIGETHNQSNIIETTWKAFSSMYPDAKVLSRDTGYSRNYDSYPYSRYDYLNSETIIFQTKYDDSKEPYSLYHPKALTVVVKVNNSYALFPFEELDTSIPMTVNHNGQDLVIFFNKGERFALPLVNNLDGLRLTFRSITNDEYAFSQHFGLSLYKDQLGNVWNMKGVAIDGPNKGEQLSQYTSSYNAFWFAATSFFGNGTLYFESDNFDTTGTNIPEPRSSQINLGDDIGEYTNDSVSIPIISVMISVIIIPLLIKYRRDE